MKPVLFFVILLSGCDKSVIPVLYSNRGQVTIASATFRSGNFMYSQSSVTAGFVKNTLDPQAGCTKKSHGDCQIIECGGVVTAPPPDEGASIYVSAGEVELSGAKQPVKLQVMTMGMFPGQYTTWNGGTPLFAAGDALTARAPGEIAPAFSATVTAPAQPILTAPTRPARGTLAISRGSDFQLAWSGGGAGRFELSLTVVPPSDLGPGSTSTGMSCSFAAGANSGTVPKSALAALPAGTGSLYFTVGERTHVTTAGWTIEVGAATVPVDGMGQQWDSVGVQLD